MQQSEKGLKRGLSARHIRFMALGSAIGTGLFYGSASAIQMAVLAYLTWVKPAAGKAVPVEREPSFSHR